ncbi:MAG: hypothetical protein NWR26_02695 [Pseudomonadales bacterium]|jgi:hypothetical protein|nr:hypothetical protein [Pseudomonadales bacterium]MDP4910640.1 hypothetical protein [Pseudomonadales bacterium]MDP5059851.1 hypothetical protein [Pseudomonadales bacterium]
MTSDSKATRQYLATYAEAEVAQLDSLTLGTYHHCLVVPAHREAAECLQRIWPHQDPGLLLILVLNSGTEDDPITRRMLASLLPAATSPLFASHLSIQQAGNLHLIQRHDQPDLLVVDRCQPGRLIPASQGVGLARKIGADLALALICKGLVGSPWINSTDADVSLPADYFSTEDKRAQAAAAAQLHPFRHVFSADLELASRLYDIAMDYYVLGLRWAGSRYGFHSIGSTLSINARHYAQVRGFPRRNAAEDFYLLNKLAKTGTIALRSGQPILIEARLSDRAPFGTGPTLTHISAMHTPITEYHYYDPQIFSLLRTFLRHADNLLTMEPQRSFAAQPQIMAWIEASGLAAQVQRQRRTQTQTRVFQRFLRDWFDGFRTLKFIHFMRAEYYPSINLHSVCDGLILPVKPIHDLNDVRLLHQDLKLRLQQPATEATIAAGLTK